MDLENFYVSFTLKHWSSLFTIPRMDLVYTWYEDIYGPKFYTVPPPPPTQPQDLNCYVNVFRTTLLVSLGQVTDLKLLEFFVMLLMDSCHLWNGINKCFRIKKHLPR